MDQRQQFLADHLRGRFTMRELCERYGISRKTGYQWVTRVAEEGTPLGARRPSRGR